MCCLLHLNMTGQKICLTDRCVGMQIVAVITPVSANGSGNATEGTPDLALIGVPVVSPYPLPPRPAAPPVTSPAARQAALPRAAAPAPGLPVSAASSAANQPLTLAPATPLPSSSAPPATTPAPALSASLLIQVGKSSEMILFLQNACHTVWDASIF